MCRAVSSIRRYVILEWRPTDLLVMSRMDADIDWTAAAFCDGLELPQPAMPDA